MKNIHIKLHYYQKELIKKLTLSKDPLKFSELEIEGLSSEHMNYHLKKLITFNFVKKSKNGYLLTNEGKDYSNLLEDDVKTLEKQPKTSIIIGAIREKDGKIEHLLSKRLRQPYYGRVGRLTGKVKFGETLKDAVSRELYEETGLKAKDIELYKVYRKMRYNKDGELVQDVVFFIFLVQDLYDDFKVDELSEVDNHLFFEESTKKAEGY